MSDLLYTIENMTGGNHVTFTIKSECENYITVERKTEFNFSSFTVLRNSLHVMQLDERYMDIGMFPNCSKTDIVSIIHDHKNDTMISVRSFKDTFKLAGIEYVNSRTGELYHLNLNCQAISGCHHFPKLELFKVGSHMLTLETKA